MSFDEVPDEIIRQILYFAPPDDTLCSVQTLSHRFHALANERLLWRHYCRASFRYWRDDHRIQDKLRGRASAVDWKALYLGRKKTNVRIARLLDGVIATRVGRLDRLGQICRSGYDAKDFLLEQCQTSDSAEDVLARRYYANTALDSIHRGAAVDVWVRYQGAHSGPPLEQALGAFDMFVLHDQPQDLGYISSSLDDLAQRFRLAHPNSEAWPTRHKALALVQWLRASNLTGMADPMVNYRNLRNCLIGHALSDPRHDSLPLVSSAIFCAVAERLGMQAACCAFPNHVHASVSAPAGQTLDGRTQHESPETMYVDPYGSDGEVSVDELRFKLLEVGWTSSPDIFLRASTVPEIVQRTAQNIRATFQRSREMAEGQYPTRPGGLEELGRLRAGFSELNLEAALYGTMWARLLTTEPANQRWGGGLRELLHRFALTWSEDAWLVEQYLAPVYDSLVAAQRANPPPQRWGGWDDVHEVLGMLRNLDQRQPTLSRRYTQELRDRVRFRIGQVFCHRRYRYLGVINGWAVAGTVSGPAMLLAPRDALSADESDGGDEALSPRQQHRGRIYYTCFRPGIDRMRVAQQNIEIVTDPDLVPPSLVFQAGKFFKRFDRETCTFVSNVKEYYPDD